MLLRIILKYHPVVTFFFHPFTLCNSYVNCAFFPQGVGSSISGFTRGLILRLLLRSERISIAICTKNENEATSKDANITFNPRITTNGPLPPRYLATHPSLHGSILLSLLHQTQLSDVILQHVICSEYNALYCFPSGI